MQQNLALLHGWGMQSSVWQQVISRLPATFNTSALDLPGYGRTHACEPYTLLAVAQQLEKKIKGNAILCGWSLGGLIAMQIAKMIPEKITKLILVSSTPCFVAKTDWPYGMQLSSFKDFYAASRAHPKTALMRFLTLQAHQDENNRDVLIQLRRNVVNKGNMSHEILWNGLNILRETDLRPMIDKLKQKTLLIHGDRDSIIPLAAAQQLQQKIRHARLRVIEGAAHAPFFSNPQVFCDELLEFINDR